MPMYPVADVLADLQDLPLWEVMEHLPGCLPKDFSYLEIGFGEGGSMKAVCADQDHLPGQVTVVDAFNKRWGGVYDMAEGPKRVQGLLTYLGVEDTTIHAMESTQFFKDAETEYDLVLVDGDHSEEGGAADLQVCTLLVKLGGWIVFDDIRHPKHQYLEKVWDDWLEMFKDHFVGIKTEGAHPVGVATRVSL